MTQRIDRESVGLSRREAILLLVGFLIVAGVLLWWTLMLAWWSR